MRSTTMRTDAIRNEDFLEYHKHLPELEFESFLEAIQGKRRVSILVNTLKTSPQKLFQRLQINTTPIPWCRNGFWIESMDSDWIGKTLSYALGYYYVQNALSMIPPVVLNPSPGERILDMCAAPGSKTTQLGQYMHGQGVIIANEANPNRAKTLIANVQRIGLTNAVITVMNGAEFGRFEQSFDKVLVDAPCSAVGTELKAAHQWSMETVHRLSSLQKRLIVAGFKVLSEGGVLVYSTCTTPAEENEEVVEFLLSKFHGEAILEEIQLPGLKCVPGLTEATRKAIRVFPYHHNSGSFFVARIRRRGKSHRQYDSTKPQSEAKAIRGDFRLLTRTEVKMISRYMQDRFGYNLPSAFSLVAKGKKLQRVYTRVYAFSGSLHELSSIPIKSIGLFIGSWEGDEFRPSIEGAEIIGKAKRNVIYLNEVEAKKWMNGDKLLKSVASGCYLINYDNMFLGGGFSNGREITNFQPRIFNIDVLK